MGFHSHSFPIFTQQICFLRMPEEPSKGIGYIDPGLNAPKGENFLLAIGINQYEHLPHLSNAVQDAKAFIALLQKRYQFDPEHTKELYDEEATRKNIYQALEVLVQDVTPKDNVVIYFSGHGAFKNNREEGFWIPVEAEQDAYYDFLPNVLIQHFLGRIKSHHTYVVVDSCFSGTLFAEQTRSDVAPMDHLPSRWVLTSCGNELASDGTPGGHSPFAQNLILFLDNNKDSLLPITFLNENVAKATQANSAQKPVYGPVQGTGHRNGQFYFRSKQDEGLSWEAALASNSVQALLDFEAEFPRSSHVTSGELDDRIAGLEEEDLWREASRLNTVTSFRKYLRSTELGAYRQEARSAIERILHDRDASQVIERESRETEAKEVRRQQNEEEAQKEEAERKRKEEQEAERRRKAEEEKKKVIVPEMIFVRGGAFTMGCTQEQGLRNCSKNEKPAHRVSVNSFKIGKFPVTQTEWEAVMGRNPCEFKGCDQCPVERVSWNDVQIFLEKLNQLTGKNYRLPTEAEWEFAARGGNKSKGTKFSGSSILDDVAWYTKNSKGKTHPVGQKKANELGIHDMIGNVWEWCADYWHDDYNNAPDNGRAWVNETETGNRVIRGGSWSDYGKRVLRISDRSRKNIDFRSARIGFRIVHD